MQRIARAETGGIYAWAVGHGDSMLFAVAVVLLTVNLLERPSRSRLVRAAVTLPLIVLGMMENDPPPRLGDVARVLPRHLPRRADEDVKAIADEARGRCAARRAPVRRRRDGTTETRSSRHQDAARDQRFLDEPVHVLAGGRTGTSPCRCATGPCWAPVWGARTRSTCPTTVLSSGAYKEFREWPHNSVIGLLFCMGLFGFTATWALLAGVFFLAVRSYRMATAPEHRVAALGCVAAVIACQVMAWGDLGAHFVQYKVFAGLAIAVSAKLAVVTGAWPARHRQLAAGARAPASPAASLQAVR